MTGTESPDRMTEIDIATIAVLAVGAAEFLSCDEDELQLVHDSILRNIEESLPKKLNDIRDFAVTFYRHCFYSGADCPDMFFDNPEIYEVLKEVAKVVQPPASMPPA